MHIYVIAMPFAAIKYRIIIMVTYLDVVASCIIQITVSGL